MFRIIIRSPNPLGDACMAMPAVRAIKRSCVDSHLTICCRENLAAIWEEMDEIDEVIPFPRKLSPWQVGKAIRSVGKFDAGVLLPNSFRSALELRLGGVSNLLGYNRYQRGFLLKTRVDRKATDPEQPHHVHVYLALAKAFGATTDSAMESLLAIPQPPTPITEETSDFHIGICPGAEYGNAKRYPVKRYAEAVRKLREKHPTRQFQVSIFGSPAERGIGEELTALIGGDCVNRVGETSIAGLVDELKTCHFLASNDTGTMHLAAALGVPTVAIFGSTEPDFTAPIGDVHRIIRHRVDCSPCFLRECPIDYRCMLRVEPDRVVREMEALLPAASSL